MNGIILASGYSTRMGKNKLMMKINNEEIIKHVIKEVKKSNINNVILVAREKDVLDIGKDFEIKIFENKDAHLGQSTSIKIGIRNCENNENYMFFCGDQPFVDFESINKLIEVSNKHKDNIIVPKVNGRIGSPVIFPKVYKTELSLLTGDVGGREIIKNNKENIIYVEIDNLLFLEDIDTEEDYKNLSKL